MENATIQLRQYYMTTCAMEYYFTDSLEIRTRQIMYETDLAFEYVSIGASHI